MGSSFDLGVSNISEAIRDCGISGAGGAGFPTYTKWKDLDSIDYLLMNHQDSEPNFHKDKYLFKKNTDKYIELFDFLLDDILDLVVVGVKEVNREKWMEDIEEKLDPTIYLPEDLPINLEDEFGVVFAYTENQYKYGMEGPLLKAVSGTTIGKDVPMDHGWIVDNTETLYNIYQAFKHHDPVVNKYLHIDGENIESRFINVPIGSPIIEILDKFGISKKEIDRKNLTALDGGPGWCFEVDIDTFSVRKNTNCILLFDKETVKQNKKGNHIDITDQYSWKDKQKNSPVSMKPSFVRIPLITNPNYEGIVYKSIPIVETGEKINKCDKISKPNQEGYSIPKHASISGNITEINNTEIEITK